MRPVKKVEVDHKHVRLRVVLLVLCILVAVFALWHGFHLLVSKQPGWQTVEISSDTRNCSGDFTLQYYLSGGVNQEYRQVVAVYEQACTDAYRYFHTDGELGTIVPNTPVEVSSVLYQALEQIQSSGNRCIYLAPVCSEYRRMFLCDNEAEAAIYDPQQNEEIAQQIAELAAWCNDPDVIDLKLLGDNRVELKVTGQYLLYTQEFPPDSYLDFGWMTNAFVADYLAQQLTEHGLTKGYLASFDGFTRNLYAGSESFSLNIFDKQGAAIDKPAVLTYQGPMSLAVLRNYPMTEQDRWQYFAFSDGHITTAMVDPADGVSKSAVNSLVVYSPTESCATLALEAAPLYLQESWSDDAMTALKAGSIYGIWSQGKTLYHTEPSAVLTVTDSGYTVKEK